MSAVTGPAGVPPIIAQHAVKADGLCRWYAACDHDAVGTVEHASLGPVPCCERCADRHGLTIERWCGSCGAAGLRGVFWPMATDSNEDHDWIERCDECAVYASDEEAGRDLARHLDRELCWARLTTWDDETGETRDRRDDEVGGGLRPYIDAS